MPLPRPTSAPSRPDDSGRAHPPAEINRELAIIRRAFRLAQADDKYHGRIPKIPMLQERNVREGFFDDSMIEAVKAKLPAALRPIVTFAYITGWRVQSEVLPLEWRHIDRKAKEARLEPGTTKNQAGRVFPFTDALDTLITELWRQHEALKEQETICPYVFHRNGKEADQDIQGRDGQRCATWSGPACRGRSPCSSPGI